MITDINQIENVNDIYVLKDCWDAPCGMGSGQIIINNRWMIPITYVADKCSMTVTAVLNEHIFAGGIDADFIGTRASCLAKAGNSAKGYFMSSTLAYKDGSKVYIYGTNIATT